MTKFDGNSAASRWLRVLKEELRGPLSPGTWLERADARLEGRAASWAERTPEVIRILADNNIETATVEDKNTFVQLLIQEFPGDSRDVVTDEQASAELSSLAQKEGEDLYTYYRRTESLLKGIHRRDQVTNNGRDTVALSPAEQQLLKDTIMKFILGIKNLDLQFRVVEYRANPTPSLYGAYKLAESTLPVLHTQAQIQESREQKQGYEAFRSFQASIGNDYRSRPSYDPPPRRNQPMQPNLAYREGKKVERNLGYTNCDSDPTSARNMYTPQDARASQDFSYNRSAAPASFNSATSRNTYVNGSSQYVYQWGNPLCYKCGVPGHTAPECYSDTPLSRAESTHLRNLYQRPATNREPDFPIPSQAQSSRGFSKDQQRPDNNPITAQSNSVTAETMTPTPKHSSRGRRYEATRDDFKR